MRPAAPRLLASLALAVGLAPALARADTVTLKNGREIHGRLVEERLEDIRIRTEGGTIVIRKAEIATFSENENFGDYGGRIRPAAGTQPGTPAPGGEGGTPAEGGQPDAQPGTPGATPPAGDEWRWPEGLSREEIKVLEELKAKYEAELEELGATKEERLKAVEATTQERSAMQELIRRFGLVRRQGSANLRREQARDELVSQFGVKAIPLLADSVKSENQWISRISAQAIGLLAGGDADGQRKWLMFHLRVPAALLPLLDHQGEVDSPFIRQEADQALKAIAGNGVGFVASRDPLRTPAETQAMRAWQRWWTAAEKEWTEAEATKAARRVELKEKLEALRRGENPEEQASTQPPPRR